MEVPVGDEACSDFDVKFFEYVSGYCDNELKSDSGELKNAKFSKLAQNLFLNIADLMDKIFFSHYSKNFEPPYLKN